MKKFLILVVKGANLKFCPKIGHIKTEIGPKVPLCPVEGLNWGPYGGHKGQIAPVFLVRPPPTKNPGSAPVQHCIGNN